MVVRYAMLGKEKLSLAEKTIVAQCIGKDSVNIFGSGTYVPITKDFINAARMVCFEHTLYLEKERRAKADKLQKTVEADKVVEKTRQLQKTKESILELLRAEEKAEKEQKRELATAKEILNEASMKMGVAIQHSNMQPVKVAQMMLKAGNDKLQETSNKLDVIHSNQQSLRK